MWKRLPLDRTCPIPEFRERARREWPLRRLPVARVQSAVQEQISRQIVGLGDASIPHLALDQGTRTSLPLSPPCSKNASCDFVARSDIPLCRRGLPTTSLFQWNGGINRHRLVRIQARQGVSVMNRFAAVCPVLLRNEGQGFERGVLWGKNEQRFRLTQRSTIE